MEEDPVSAMADSGLGLPWHPEAGIGDGPRKLRAEIALRLRRDGLGYIRQRLDAGGANLLALVLEVTAGAAYIRADQLNQTLTVPAGAPTIPADRLPIDCCPGCSACCHLTVEATIPEAILVAQALADPAHPRRPAVLAAAEAFAGLDTAQRLRTGRPCPLLQADKSCAVYDRRPLACRGFMAPEAGRCHAALANAIAGSGDDTIRPHALPQFFGRGYKAGISGLCRDLGLQHDTVELVATVAALLEDPALAERWAAGEVVFTPFRGGE